MRESPRDDRFWTQSLAPYVPPVPANGLSRVHLCSYALDIDRLLISGATVVPGSAVGHWVGSALRSLPGRFLHRVAFFLRRCPGRCVRGLLRAKIRTQVVD